MSAEDELATELADERTLHQQTIAALEALWFIVLNGVPCDPMPHIIPGQPVPPSRVCNECESAYAKVRSALDAADRSLVPGTEKEN